MLEYVTFGSGHMVIEKKVETLKLQAASLMQSVS